MSKLIAVAYLRVSGKGQVSGDGFTRQLEEIKHYAKAHDVELKNVYQEEGISGTTGETDRPAFQEMVSALLKNGCRTVIIEGMDRLAREVRIQETLLIYLASKGITLISARTEENVTQAIQADPMKKALVQIQGVFAELEKSLLVKKLRIAREHKRQEQGKCEGRKSTKELNPEIVALIKKLHRKPSSRSGQKRMTYARIADELNAQGYLTTSGKAWNTANVQNIAKRF